MGCKTCGNSREMNKCWETVVKQEKNLSLITNDRERCKWKKEKNTGRIYAYQSGLLVSFEEMCTWRVPMPLSREKREHLQEEI